MVGTGPWILDNYRPNVGYTLVRNPELLPGRASPHRSNRGRRWTRTMPRAWRPSWPASTISAGSSRARSTGPTGSRSRTSQAPAPDPSDRRVPEQFGSKIFMRTDKPPFSDVRVRRAVSLAFNRQAIIDAVYEGAGVINAAVPRRSRTGRFPSTSSARAPATTSTIPPKRRRRSPRPVIRADSRPPWPSRFRLDPPRGRDAARAEGPQVGGHRGQARPEEYGAFISTTAVGNFESISYGPATPFLDPDNFLYGPTTPVEPKNHSHVNDPVLTDLLIRQRRTPDLAKRREVIHDIQRYVASQQYSSRPSGSTSRLGWGAQELRPNLGYDYGGRVLAAWLDR